MMSGEALMTACRMASPLPHRLVGLPALGHVHDIAEGVDQHALVVVDEPGQAKEPAVAVLEQEEVR